MTSIGPINTAKVQQLSTLGLKAVKLSDEEIKKMEEAWKSQFLKPVGKADNDDSNIYATVKVGGKVVATLYNSGASVTSNATHAQVGNLPSFSEDEKLVGPELAKKRAEDVAKKLGGTIEQAATAQTQAQWMARPAQQWTYDFKAMAEAQAARDAAAKTRVDTQIIGQSDEPTAVSKFLDFMSKTPEQRWHEQWLKSHGLTEEEFAALPADEKQALVDQMTEEMKQKLEQEAKEKTKEAALA